MGNPELKTPTQTLTRRDLFKRFLPKKEPLLPANNQAAETPPRYSPEWAWVSLINLFLTLSLAKSLSSSPLSRRNFLLTTIGLSLLALTGGCSGEPSLTYEEMAATMEALRPWAQEQGAIAQKGANGRCPEADPPFINWTHYVGPLSLPRCTLFYRRTEIIIDERGQPVPRVFISARCPGILPEIQGINQAGELIPLGGKRGTVTDLTPINRSGYFDFDIPEGTLTIPGIGFVSAPDLVHFVPFDSELVLLPLPEGALPNTRREICVRTSTDPGKR